jgi:hypothetical protein
MFNGSLIEDLFAVVQRAENSARPALPEVSQSGVTNAEPMIDFDFPQDRRREVNSEAE